MAKTIAELAPTLVAGGLSETEIKDAAHAEPVVKPPAQDAPIQPKRYREAMALLLAEPGISDADVVKRVASMRLDVVAKLRGEVAAVKADKTAVVTPVEEAKPLEPVEGDPKVIG
ncbi:MAG: hypothetical protein WC683_02340 [bacterium]